jgi:hypothetical protein
MTSPNDNPPVLPFDQHERYRIVAEALAAARPFAGARLRVLDVGGLAPQLRGAPLLPGPLFLPDDEVTTLDQPACDLPGYVQGDGRTLPFGDGSYDFVIACDVLEHVPAADRPAFWRELLRVARCGVAITAPFDSPEVAAAEELLFGYIKAELGVEQLQLREHRDFGRPRIDDTLALLAELGVVSRSYPSGYIHAWLAMMIAKHYLLSRSDDIALHEGIDAYFTRFLSAADRREPAYRHLVIAAHPACAHWLDAADAALAPTIAAAQQAQQPEWPDLAAWLQELLGYDPGGRPQTLAQTTHAQLRHIAALEAEIARRDAQIADLTRRADWLAAQATAARDALAAVERGRIMRLLRKFTRTT